MPSIGGPELILVVVVVLIVFGAGKLPTVFGQVGKGIRSFREEAEKDPSKPISATTATGATASKYCSSCGKPNNEGAKFCAGCGTPLAA